MQGIASNSGILMKRTLINQPMDKTIQIAVVGSGYVGLVAAVCFAEMGHRVLCVDNDDRKVEALRAGATLIHEQHLPELLGRYRNREIQFTTDLGAATRA